MAVKKILLLYFEAMDSMIAIINPLSSSVLASTVTLNHMKLWCTCHVTCPN